MNRPPIGPLIASALLAALGTIYFLSIRPFRPAENLGRPRAEFKDPLRLLTWNLDQWGSPRPDSGGMADPQALADAISRAAPHVVMLQNVTSREFAERLGRILGTEWKVVTAGGGNADPHALAILIAPTIPMVEKRLLVTGMPEEALVVTIIGPLDRPMRFVCLAAPRAGESRPGQYLSRVLDWQDKQSEGVSVLSGIVQYGVHHGSKTSIVAKDMPVGNRLLREFDLAVSRGFDDAAGPLHQTYVTRDRARVAELPLPGGGRSESTAAHPILLAIETR